MPRSAPRAGTTLAPKNPSGRCAPGRTPIASRKSRADAMHVQKKPDNCSFVIFGVTGDLTHRLVIPALYNLAAGNLLPENFCLVGVARKGMTSAQLSDSLMKGLRQYATRKIDDAVAKQLFSCVTCIEADNKDP